MRRSQGKHSKPVCQQPPAWVGRLYLQPKPNIRTRRFFPVKPAMMLDDYLEKEEQLRQQYSHRQRSPLMDKLPAIDPNAHPTKKPMTSRRDCHIVSEQLIPPPEKHTKTRLLSPKILKFRSESLAKRSRIFSADSKARVLKQNSGLLFTFARELQI